MEPEVSLRCSLVPILLQINTFRARPVSFNIILPSMPWPSKRSFSPPKVLLIHMCYMTAHPFLLDSIIRIIFAEECKSWSFSLRSLLQFLVNCPSISVLTNLWQAAFTAVHLYFLCQTSVSILWTTSVYMHLYRVSRGECARLQEKVPYVKVHRSNPKHLYPKLNGYGDNGERKVWSSCRSTSCTCFACCYPYTAHVRPSVSQPSQAHSAFIINRCHSYSEL